MSISNNINGVWRETQDTLCNINGVWRSSQVYTNINGVWRLSNENKITEDNIIGFRIVYEVNKNKVSKEYPQLKFNENLPIRIYKIGDNSDNMDQTTKGIRYHYSRFDANMEGNYEFDGRLYAILLDDTPIDVGNINEWTGNEVGLYNKNIDDLSITINGYLQYVSDGLYFSGWNNMFRNYQLNPNFKYPDKKEELKQDFLISLLPLISRKDYSPIAEIGISRSIKTELNMVGTYGIIDHVIRSITVNGVTKPFIFEIY